MVFQANLHTQAYFQSLLAALESPDTRQLHLTRLKKVGLVTGGLLAGTVLLGPIGLVIGAGVAGSKAYHMKHYDGSFAAMLDVIRALDNQQKRRLVSRTETLVGSPDTDDLSPFIKVKENRERFLNLVSNFLSEEVGYEWPSTHHPNEKEGALNLSRASARGSPYHRLGKPAHDPPSPNDEH